tara:strand:+ start:70 stop:1326 length:1257 start_codon:yes stop_codon:yes gene_type:complete
MTFAPELTSNNYLSLDDWNEQDKVIETFGWKSIQKDEDIQLAAHSCCCCCCPSCISAICCNKPKELLLGNEETKLGIVRYKQWHDIHQIIITVAVFVATTCHLFQVYSIVKNAIPTSIVVDTTHSLSECAFFNQIHNVTNNDSKQSENVILEIVTMSALFIQFTSCICLYLKHNFDRGLIRPIVTTPEVIILIWACFAMVFLEAWLMMKGATRLFYIAYKVMLFIELLLVVFMDAAVRVTHAFQLFHSLVLIFLICLDLIVTMLYCQTDYALFCPSNTSVVISSFMIQRLLSINILTSLGPSVVVLCTNRSRTLMRFAEIPVDRISYATLISEGSSGEEARVVLTTLTRKNAIMTQKLKHVQKTIFRHTFGGGSNSMSFNEQEEATSKSNNNSSLNGFGHEIGSVDDLTRESSKQPLI